MLAVWQVEYTDQFEQWWDKLSMEEQAAIDVTVEVLQERGPGLGRPLVETVKGSRYGNMKELRPRGGFIRICLRSIHDGQPYCSWEGTSAIAGVPGTRR